MERQLQERLIGATVLMIVAVLVVPELLSGPKPMASPPAAIASNDSSRRDPSSMGTLAPVPATVVAGAVPSPSGAASTAASRPRPPTEQAIPPVSPAVAPVPMIASPVKPSHAPPVQTPPSSAATGAPVATSAAPRVAGHAPLKPSSDKPISEKGKWLVQVGSYVQAQTAKRIAKDLQNHGFTASVLPVDLRGKRLYRVRVGPATDRKTAEETLRRVQHLMPSSRLVGNQ